MKWFFIFFLLMPLPIHAEENKSVQQVVDACSSSPKKEGICNIIITVKQLGDDSIETIKEYMDLGPYEYAFLTFANMVANRRLRIKSGVPYLKGVTQTIDIQPSESSITWEYPF